MSAISRQNKMNLREDAPNLFSIIGFACYFAPEPYAVSKLVLFVWRLAICIVSAIALYNYLRYRRITLRWLSLVSAVVSYYLLSSFINRLHANWLLITFYTIDVIGFITLLDYGLSEDFETTLKSFIIAGIIMCGVHYITFLMYRNIPFGMRYAEMSAVKYRMEDGIWFFLKHDNGSVFYFLPVLGAMWYYVCEYGALAKTTFICTALTLYMYWSQWSVAAMLVSTLMTILCTALYFDRSFKVFPLLSYRTSLIIGICTSAFVVHAVSNPGEYLYWFSNLVQRSVAFSGRGIIWPRAIEVIKSSPIIGIGCESDATTIMRLTSNHAHNMLLQILYTGGIVTFFLMAVGVFKNNGTKGSRVISRGQACLNVTVLAVLIAASVDWYLYLPVQFATYIIHYNSQFADKNVGLHEKQNGSYVSKH